MKALGVEKGGGDGENIGDLSIQELMDIAKKKQDSLLAKNYTNAIKEVAGVCQSMDATIEDRKGKHLIEEIEMGRLDEVISGETTEMPEPLEREEEEVEIVGRLELEEEEEEEEGILAEIGAEEEVEGELPEEEEEESWKDAGPGGKEKE